MKIELSKIQLPEKDLRVSVDNETLWELADSMQSRGQLQPIGVREIGNGLFEIVFGARRYRAAKLLEWTEIEASLTELPHDKNTAADKLIENVQRENLTPIEEAYGLFELIGDSIADVRALQKQTGKSTDWIKTRLALLDLPEDLQARLQAEQLTIGVARALGRIENEELRFQYTANAVEANITAATAEHWADHAKFAEAGILPSSPNPDANGEVPAEIKTIEHEYHCFVCIGVNSWRNINTLIVCKDCQNAITARRSQAVSAS